MMINRYKYRIILALDNAMDGSVVAREIGENLTRLFGGCTLTTGHGYWSPESDQTKPPHHMYEGLYVETAHIIEVVVTQDETPLIKETVRHCFRHAKKMHGIDGEGQWIHFERIPLYCEHFQIKFNK